MSIKGSALIYVVILALIAGGLFLYLNPQQLDSIRNISTRLPFGKTLTHWSPPKDWSSIDYYNYGLTLKYPPDWIISENEVLSQYPLPSSVSNISNNQVYNYITIKDHTGALFNGIYDIDLFDRIYRSSEGDYFNPETIQQDNKVITKISSGTVASGERFVVFKFESTNIPSNGGSQIQAYILKSNSIIIITLKNYDDPGTETFQKIVASAQLQ